MQDNVSLATSEKDIEVKYGMYDLGPERKEARGSLKYILTDMNDIRKSFIRLGFHLAEMLHNKYYEDFGFPTMEEFAEANLGMDKSNVYRYIRVYEQFGAVSEPTFSNALSSTPPKMFLDDRWKDYSFSQLVEMCSMSDNQRRACNPGMTIKQIREVKKTVAKDVDWAFLNKIVSGQPGQDDVKVAMSPQKDKSKEFSYDYCSGLHGAAQAAYVKSRAAKGNAVIYVYDSDGVRVDTDPMITNVWADLLYCKEDKYVFRLCHPVGKWQRHPEQDQGEEGD